MPQELLRLAGIHKAFGGVPALRDASLEVRAGEVVGLVGENGAGKSTLINIATGVLQPDAGAIELDGRAVRVTGPQHAAALGVAVVHQEADLFAQLSIAENMLLGSGLVRGPGGLIDWAATYREADRLVATMGEPFDVRRTAGGLPVARRMLAEIASAVGSGRARVLFLDEPTSSLTLNEITHLFERVRALRDAGVGVVYVSHRLQEVLDLCDRVTVMRDGVTVRSMPVAECTMESIVQAMVGRAVGRAERAGGREAGEVRLAANGLRHAAGAFSGASLEVRAGEVVGLYGFVGAGRSELGQALFGLERTAGGTVRVDGRAVQFAAPRDAVAAGVAYLPEDRLVQGVFRTHSVRTNASVATLRRICRLGIVDAAAERRQVDGVVREMRVRTDSIEQPIVTLSGGNQQKVVFGRWQCADPKVLVLDEPTRGVDVGAKAEIHRLVGETAARGAAVLLISSDLPEVMALSDRVLTMSEGRLTGTFDPRADTEEAVAAAAVPRAVGELGAARARGAAAGAGSVRELGIVAFIVLLAAVMAALKPGAFANVDNFMSILARTAIPAIVAQGAMLIICAGGIDISVGSMLGLVSAVTALAAKGGAPPGICLPLAMALGCGLSLVNASTSLLARIHPIIVTLAGISVYRGLLQVVMGGQEIEDLPAAYRMLADGNLLGVPKVVYYVLIVTAITHVLVRYTLVGRRVLALGDSETAARLIGLSKTRLTLFVFAVSGALVGLAAVLDGGYYGNIQANSGEGMELQAIAAAVIGGTNIMGGRGSAIGTLLGAFLVALVGNALVLLQVSSFWQNMFVGGLILLAVVTDVTMQRRRAA